jgi:hypothetical protein
MGDADSLFTAEQIIKLKKIFDERSSDATEFEKAIHLNKANVIFSQEDFPRKNMQFVLKK